VVWGLLHGVALVAHKIWRAVFRRPRKYRGNVVSRFFGILITFHFVCFCWLIFRNADLSASRDMLQQIFTNFRPQVAGQWAQGYCYVLGVMLLGYLLHFLPDSWERACTRLVIRMPLLFKALLLLAVIYLVIQVKSADIQPFIYFQF